LLSYIFVGDEAKKFCNIATKADEPPMRLSTSSATTSSAPVAPSAAAGVAKDLNLLANDASSDDLSTTSDDVAVNDASKSENREPLSFARIASLNLEKQQVRLLRAVYTSDQNCRSLTRF
jgi:hypothetical protein